MIDATTETGNVTFVIGFSAGGVLIVTLVGLWIRAWLKKKNGGGSK